MIIAIKCNSNIGTPLYNRSKKQSGWATKLTKRLLQQPCKYHKIAIILFSFAQKIIKHEPGSSELFL